ncbi:unnamed protein product [Medioppia subpectinata]|uniref:cysteine--tRNA ligase n=1 Tax=Medioppia subpectinata TaxID=1979941 RepID=A0A7R9KF89_9ACAR|nr:unnamed protein product [Medioppia subpectinata]CAG2102261.1 unnamed protein product [Medioppia subpectinata]
MVLESAYGDYFIYPPDRNNGDYFIYPPDRNSMIGCETCIHVTPNLTANHIAVLKATYVTFTKTKEPLIVTERADTLDQHLVTMYCCGPTVYEDSHLGHAITYIRADLIRRALRHYHNISVLMAMNVTDIDDKIIAKAIETDSNYRKVSNHYYNSFIDDMKALNVLDADCYLRVTDHLKTIMDYINTIRDKGFAYINANNDINFDFNRFVDAFNITHTIGTDGSFNADKVSDKRLCPLEGRQTGRLSETKVQNNNELNARNERKVLLENSFTKTKEPLIVTERADTLDQHLVTMYCCGPTVYEDSHLGHAITYIRADLIRRALRHYHNISVLMAMNVTDIDDKIIVKAIETDSNYRKVSNHYYNSFIDDMKALNVLDADCYLRVTDHMKTIMDYINTIRDKGFAYINANNDINFDFNRFVDAFNITHTIGTDGSFNADKVSDKRSPKDFALWKAAKPGEPKWDLVTTDGIVIAGRPGWHIECSALAHKVFGHQIDVHFGGSDLRFPHHHCESCCCHAFYQTPDQPMNALYDWVRIWLHSGHLNLKSEKMSKSLGNVILIKDFLKSHSPNILRLFCIKLHYRSDLVYDENLLQEMKNIDKKLLDFTENLNLKIYEFSMENLSYDCIENRKHLKQSEFFKAIDETEKLILDGIADDLDLEMGLNAILLLAKQFNSTNDFSLLDLIRTKQVLNKWLDSMGLLYKQSSNKNDGQSVKESLVIKTFIKFRSDIRALALNSIIKSKNMSSNPQLISDEIQKNNKEMLSLCDAIRQDLDGFGIKFKARFAGF